MPYSIKEEINPKTGEVDKYVVLNNGVEIDPPSRFATKDEAFARLAQLLQAKFYSLGKRCRGEIIAASDTLLLQDIGREHFIHRRADSEEFSELKVGDKVEIIDGEVEFTDRGPSHGLGR